MTESPFPAPVAPPDLGFPTPPPPSVIAAPPARRRPVALIIVTCVLSVAVLAVGALAGLKAVKIADLNTQVNKLQSDNADLKSKIAKEDDAVSSLNSQNDTAASAGKQTSTGLTACGQAVLQYSIYWKEAQQAIVTQSQVATALAAAQAACTPVGVTVHTPS